MPINLDAIYLSVPMGQAVLGAAPSVVYTVPSGKVAVVQQVLIANAGAATQVFVSLVPRLDGAGGLGNRIVHNVDVNAEMSLDFNLHQVLEPGDTVVGHATNAGRLTMTVAGVVFDWTGDTGAWDALPLTTTWDSLGTLTWDQLGV